MIGKEFKTGLLRGAGVLLVVLGAATWVSCGGGSGLSTSSPDIQLKATPVNTGLPPISDLDDMPFRAVSVTDEIKHKDQGDQFHIKSDNSWVEGDDILFDTGPGGLGYVIFHFGEFKPEDTIYEFKTNAWNHNTEDPDNFGYYVAQPNFSRGGWDFSDKLTDERKKTHPIPGTDYISPAGNTYIAVVFHDNQLATLSSVTTYWDLFDRDIPDEPVDHLVGDLPTEALLGSTVSFSFEALDIADQLVDTFNAAGHLSADPAGMVVLDDAGFTEGEAYCEVTFDAPGIFEISLDNAHPAINGVLGTILIIDPVDHLTVNLPDEAMLGDTVDFSLEVRDSSDQVIADFAASGQLSAAPAGMSVISDAEFTGGLASCSVRFDSAGTFQVSLANVHPALDGLLGSVTVIDPVDHLLGGPPSSADMNAVIAFTLKAVDADGIVIDDFDANGSLSSNPTGIEIISNAVFASGVADCEVRFATPGSYSVMLTGTHPNLDGLIGSISITDPNAEPRLPVFEVEIDPDDLEWLIDNPDNTEYLPIVVTIDGEVYNGSGMKLRGASAKYLPKKSWKIRLPDNNQYPHPVWGYQIRSFNINATHPDSSMMRERLSYDVFEGLGALSPRAEHALLYINDEYYGVYTSVENNRRGWLDEFGYNNDGPLYQGKDSRMWPVDDYYDAFEKELRGEEPYTEIETLCEALDSWEDEEIYDRYYEWFDMTQLTRYMVGNTLISQADHGHKNYYLYFDEFGTGLWSSIPWDHDLTWGRHWNGYDEGWGGLYNPSVKFNTPIWQGDPDRSRGGGNKLYKEYLTNDQLVSEYKQAIGAALNSTFTEDRMLGLINDYYDLIHEHVLDDDRKWGENEDYDDRVEELREYVTERRAFLFDEVN